MDNNETYELPSRCEFLEMLKSAQKAIREGVADAERQSHHRVRSTQAELLLWDSLIAVLEKG